MQEEFKIPLCNPMVETLFSDRYTFRIPSNINDGILLRKQPTALTQTVSAKKTPPQTSDRIPHADLTGGPVNVRSR